MEEVELSQLTPEQMKRAIELLKLQAEQIKYTKMDSFAPYQWQVDFINASKINKQLLAMTGNRCGKTFTGAFIMAIHATGLYPEWWEGYRYDKPIKAWAAGISTVTTRDILQAELLGDPIDPSMFGAGAIPLETIISTVNKVGTPNALESVLIKHVSGGTSTITFKSYEMSQDKFMGTSIDLIWLDEECPRSIFTQCITRTATTNGICYMTFTPEHGLTPLVHDFMNDIKDGQYMITATWDDAEHLDEATKEQLLSVYSPMEREMRSKGVPSLGSGVVFPISNEEITVDPFPIPDDWVKIIGIDLGFDHPNGAVTVTQDPATKVFYLIDEYSERKQTVPTHSIGIRAMGGDRIPCQFPHDAFKHDAGGSGKQFIKLYEDQGVNALPMTFSNPPTADGKAGGNGVEYGLHWMLTKMQEGKLKVFSTLRKWLQEKDTYHRVDGKLIKLNDDLQAASRYGLLCLERFGQSGYISESREWDAPNYEPSFWKGLE
jgi:phage terminase large subunit-like protein